MPIHYRKRVNSPALKSLKYVSARGTYKKSKYIVTEISMYIIPNEKVMYVWSYTFVCK